VPELDSSEKLKKHFDWLGDGQISDFVSKNLGTELMNMEAFLR
jgi:hypothetical protein